LSRLFFALWPDNRVRNEIQVFANQLPLDGARLVAQKNTHITLAFLGNVDEETSTALIRAASRLQVAPFSLNLDRSGWWKKPKIAWLAPTDCPEELSRLVAELGALAQSCGLALDGRPYRPHLTFARKVPRALADIPLQPISWNIKEFCLLESKTHPQGVEYQVKVSWPLKIM
jgi:RNA 2',3'-cyclic 3'-phosphodiesterase